MDFSSGSPTYGAKNIRSGCCCRILIFLISVFIPLNVAVPIASVLRSWADGRLHVGAESTPCFLLRMLRPVIYITSAAFTYETLQILLVFAATKEVRLLTLGGTAGGGKSFRRTRDLKVFPRFFIGLGSTQPWAWGNFVVGFVTDGAPPAGYFPWVRS